MSGVEACADARGYFREQLGSALRALDVKAANDTEDYLVELLAGFSVSDEAQPAEASFVELLSQAAGSTGEARMYRLRTVGDVALFVGGFLPDSCDRRGVSPRYVEAVGSRAYGELGRGARWLRDARLQAPHVFEELARRFGAFVRVLDEVREQTALCTDGSVLRIYERWLSTRSPALVRRLARRGVTPARELYSTPRDR